MIVMPTNDHNCFGMYLPEEGNREEEKEGRKSTNSMDCSSSPRCSCGIHLSRISTTFSIDQLLNLTISSTCGTMISIPYVPYLDIAALEL